MSKDFLHEAALAWYDAGCSVWPPAQDGTKRPMGEWKQFQRSPAPRDMIDGFYRQGRHDGVGLICGKVSGNLEMLELEGLATTSDAIDDIRDHAQRLGVLGLLDQLLEDGYAEWTPSGGIHFLYRLDREPPGNTKVARRPANAQELASNPDQKIKTLAETRGEGGYVIVAPSGSRVHPSGDSWSTFAGAIGKIRRIKWEDRCALLQAIHEALDRMPPEPEFTRPPAPRMVPSGTDRPGDDFNARASWEEILEPHGWRKHHQSNTEVFWTRPGKKRIDGWSATTGFAGTGLDDRLFVWSSSTQFDTEKPYSKFGAYALLEHGGDFGAATRALGARGYGQQRAARVAPDRPPAPAPASMAAVEAQAPQRPMAQGPTSPEVERNMLVINEDRWFVLQNLTKELVSRWDADRLFNFGDVICERDGLKMVPATRAVLESITHETCKVVNRKTDSRRKEGDQERLVEANMERSMLEMLMAHPKKFSTLNKLSEIPFLRPDGTICSTAGYDEGTKTFLEISPALQGISVPESPTREQVTQARDLLLDDLLGDFPLDTESDKANALATLVTPFIRDLIPTSPLAVIDAKEAGSGKNLLADIISILTTGKAAQTLPYTAETEEQRKVITSAFRSGSAMLLFDEAHEIEGAPLARALTSHSYQDRILGASNLAEFPNNRTWIALGNQVQVKGDMGRRVYRVRLEYQGARPESRDASEFKHPDLRGWATDNRRALVQACLTLARAWFALGKPAAPVPFRMGSFEKWQEALAGILWVADVPGFLDNVPKWRSESDFERQDQVAHLWWLESQFGGSEFTSGAVTDALRRERGAPHPHGMDDPFQEGFSRKLGVVYSRLKDRILDGFQLVKCSESGHGKVIKWKIKKIAEDLEESVDVT